MEYLTLFQTLEKLKGIPELYQPHGVAQLANACMKDKITPVFQYNGYALEYVSGTGDNSEYITIPVQGYLTHKNLPSLFNWTNRRDKKIEFTEATIYELTQKEELLYNNNILLAKKTFHNLRPFGNANSMAFDVSNGSNTKLYSSSNEKDAERIRELGGIEISQSDLLFPTIQVEAYIDSFICEYEERHISSSIGTTTVTQNDSKTIEQLSQELAAANAKIAELERRLAQADATLTADVSNTSNLKTQNIKKAAIKQFNRSLAMVLIDLDYKGRLRKGDIVSFIVPYMEKLAFVLADENADKAKSLIIKSETIYKTHLQGLEFKQGTQKNKDREQKNIDLLFRKQLSITE